MILSARLWVCSWGQIMRVLLIVEWMSSCLDIRFNQVALNWLVSVVQVWESCCNLARAVTRVSREQLILIPGYSEKASPPPPPPAKCPQAHKSQFSRAAIRVILGLGSYNTLQIIPQGKKMRKFKGLRYLKWQYLEISSKPLWEGQMTQLSCLWPFLSPKGHQCPVRVEWLSRRRTVNIGILPPPHEESQIFLFNAW